MRLSEDNTFKLKEAIGKAAEVYVPIPSRRKGTGKVMLSVRGAIHELDATTEEEAIPTSIKVKVTAIEDNILFVERL